MFMHRLDPQFVTKELADKILEASFSEGGK
jgi:hypothetical protein